MKRAFGAGAVLAVGFAVISPGALTLLAPLVIVAGLAAVGSWRLWALHCVLRDTDFAPALAALAQRERDDDCELATFSALQEATQYLDVAGHLLGDSAAKHRSPLWATGRTLRLQLEAFVFTGDGLGDLAAAWAIEDAAKRLAEQAAARWHRPAA